MRLHSSVGRASHRYCGGHGFKSCWSLRLFSGLSLQMLKLLHNREDHFHFCSLSAVHTYDLSHKHIISFSSYNGYKLKSLLTCFQRRFIHVAQLAEHHTSISITSFHCVNCVVKMYSSRALIEWLKL